MTQETNAIEVSPATASLIEPAADIQALKDHWQRIQELKKSILDKSDIQDIAGKTYVKRSGWWKLQSAFAISDRILSKERQDLDDGQFLWRVESEAYHARTGRSAIGLGTCSTTERKFSKPEHDVLAIAHTRSKNRAISDLIGLGEISAEEIESDQPDSVAQPIQPKSATEEICSCGHPRRLHLTDNKETHCMECVRSKKEVKCSLALQ